MLRKRAKRQPTVTWLRSRSACRRWPPRRARRRLRRFWCNAHRNASGIVPAPVLPPQALEQVATSSRKGPAPRRRRVSDLAPAAVNRIARHMQRNEHAQELATQFRARPDLAKSEKKGEGSDLVRA